MVYFHFCLWHFCIIKEKNCVGEEIVWKLRSCEGKILSIYFNEQINEVSL